jgi:hypothetical protein
MKSSKSQPSTDAQTTGRVICDYQTPYGDPLIVGAGEQLTISERASEWTGWIWCTNREGRSRWVPEKYVERSGNTCVALRDYDATELTVSLGDTLIISNQEAGWLWCTNEKGQRGWVPADRVEIQ